MKHLYTFDDKELAFLKPAQDELARRLRSVAEINGLQGTLAIAPDASGFIVPDAPVDKD